MWKEDAALTLLASWCLPLCVRKVMCAVKSGVLLVKGRRFTM